MSENTNNEYEEVQELNEAILQMRVYEAEIIDFEK